MINPSSSVEAIGDSMFEALARNFPVACASDEFYYFPQVRLPKPQWSTWDCFSSENIADIVRRLSAWEDKLEQLTSPEADLATQIDIALLQKLARTLREQLSEVRSWEFQPTFYLTLVCIGLAEAMESEDVAAKHERAMNLPTFLEQASRNLNQVPVLFRELGLEMVSDTRNYLVLLAKTLPELKPSLAALDRFEDALLNVSTRQNFLLPRDLLEHVLRSHLHCDMEIPEIEHTLDLEIEEMQKILEHEARNLVSDRFHIQGSHQLWAEALKSIPVPAGSVERPPSPCESSQGMVATSTAHSLSAILTIACPAIIPHLLEVHWLPHQVFLRFGYRASGDPVSQAMRKGH